MALFGAGMLSLGVGLVLSASFHSLWHNSLEHLGGRTIRILALLSGLLCVIYAVRILV